MISRLWYFVIAAVAGAAVAGAFVAQASINELHETSAQEALRRDRIEIELLLRTDARKRLDAIAKIAAHEDVRTALAAASSGRPGSFDASDAESLADAITTLNRGLDEAAAQVLFAVDSQGVIRAARGGSSPPDGASFEMLPIVQRALAGFGADDTLSYNGQMYRAVARPVVHGGRYVGAILALSEVGDFLATRLGDAVDAGLSFVYEGRVVGQRASAGITSAESITEVIASADEGEELAERGYSATIDVEGDIPTIAVLSSITGSASHAGAAYVISREVRRLDTPLALFDSMTESVKESINWLLAGGIALALALIGVFFLFLERDRPFSKFRAAAQALGSGEQRHLEEARLPTRFRRIAHDINEALSAAGAGSTAAPRATADLDQILGEAQAGAKNEPFGFAAESEPPAPFPGFAPDTNLGAEAPAPPVPAAAPPPAPPAPPKAPPPSPFDAAPAAVPSGDEFDEEPPTMVRAAPSELVNEAAGMDPEMRHFREVFDEFVAMKKACGEPTAGLTFERLLKTLEKNAAAIKAQHGVSEVRFRVYEKNGKAALKATPIKR